MSSQTVPSWFITALSSEKRIGNRLRVLAARESQRVAARDSSSQVAEAPKPTSTASFAFLGRKNKNQAISYLDHYSVAAGSHASHQGMNRYSDVAPYDRTRVVVHNGSVAHGGDQAGEYQGRYLNASWVLERAGHKWWIATQAPLRHTAHAFLSVMLQPVLRPPIPASESPQPPTHKSTRVRTIVQLTRNVESGRKKADAYFPSEVGRSIIVHPEEGHAAPALKVTLEESRMVKEAHCVESTVSIVPLNAPRRDAQTTQTQEVDHYVVFKHMLYASWPDHGVPDPEDRGSLLEFIRLVDKVNRDTSAFSDLSPSIPQPELDPDPPIMVGCSAGIGRTGSFIALSSLLRKYGFLPPAVQPTHSAALPASPLGSLPDAIKDDEVAQEIDSLREQRPGMVQRPEQALLIYQVLADAFAQPSQA